MIDDLERFGVVAGERDPVVGAVEGEGLAAPDAAADLDDLAGPGDRGVVADAVETLDDLGPGRAEGHVEAAPAPA